MLRKDKMILMTGITAYEQSEGKSDLRINDFFRGDYISKEVLKGAIFGTIGFGLIFLMYVLYDLEMFMVEFYKMDIVAFAKDVLQKYLIFIAVYVAITYLVAAVRYRKSRKQISKYQEALKALYSISEE